MPRTRNKQDNTLVKSLILKSKLLKIYDSDDELAVKLKTIINDLIYSDVLYKEYNRYMKYKYIRHTAWKDKNVLLNKMNQIRQRNLYYKPLVQ